MGQLKFLYKKNIKIKSEIINKLFKQNQSQKNKKKIFLINKINILLN